MPAVYVTSAISHYENFPVASLLCPAALRPSVAALYWFARTADDLADEGDALPGERLAALAQYRADLHCIEAGQSPSSRWRSLFEALARVIDAHHTVAHPFPVRYLHDLLDAFALDIQRTATCYRYKSRDELLDYCRLSAQPIGRLVLYLFGVGAKNNECADSSIEGAPYRQSDAICSALQLINFWQDISIDQPRGRFYVLDEPLQDLCLWAKDLMIAGSPLCRHLMSKRATWRLGLELKFVVQGGLTVLNKIAQQKFDTSYKRPKLKSHDWLWVTWRVLWM